ncbi:hypothetical protein [Alkalihalobacillus pseudalcaliphilus]|uniref:hypothetical protein n=1 Tax=Alkalihalobacillus pseudalcaliphilus TaxID=79884 RepID=UPI00235F3FDC|nr:hypothetical protein [Alkalihalobacillus pseudalcaliphilus]
MLVSYSLDWVMKKLIVTYFMMLFLYVFVGVFVGIIFLNFSLPSHSEEFGLLVVTLLTAIVYFHLDKLIKSRYHPNIE